jgi:hypothetical protein
MVTLEPVDWAVIATALALTAVSAAGAAREILTRRSCRVRWFPANEDETMNDQTHVPSTSDQRTANNTPRHTYRVLSDEEKARMQAIKDKGQELLDLIADAGNSRELSIARTKTEEAVMWAVKHVTA